MLAELRSHSRLVQNVPHFEHRINGDVEQFKAQVLLRDGSRLHINEVWLDGNLHKYAYYWLTAASDLLQGWDNAPHHPHVSTHPHHTHTSDGVTESTIHSLSEVLSVLESRIRR